MNSFQYSRAQDVADAIRQSAADRSARFIAGGTNLVDLMKYEVERPARLIASQRTLSAIVERHPCRSVNATSQYGFHRRQPAPAHALPLFL
jgi:xanthine dehydrogenase YagS FAD-binding subunit